MPNRFAVAILGCLFPLAVRITLAVGCSLLSVILARAAERTNIVQFLPGEEFLANYVVRSWQTEDGLPQNSVTAIAQTKDGYLWLGTFNGLARFDGVRFTTFTAVNAPGLRSDAINDLCVDSEGALWIATGDGSVSRHWQGRFQSFGPAEGIDDLDIYSITAGRNRSVWAQSRHSIFWWNAERFVKVPLDDMSVLCSETDQRGRLWVGTHRGLFEMDGDRRVRWEQQRGSILYLAIEKDDSIIYSEIDQGVKRRTGPETEVLIHPSPRSKLHVGRDGLIWLFHDPAGRLEVQSGNQVWPLGDLLLKSSSRVVMDVYEDLERNVWLGVDGAGLIRLRPKSVQTYSRKEGLCTENTVSAAQARSGEIMIGSFGEEGGVSLMREGDSSFQPLAAARGIPVVSIAESREGLVLLGTMFGGIMTPDWTGRRAPPSNVGPWAFTWDEKWQAWRATNAPKELRIVYYGPSGDLWVGTRVEGVYHWNGRELKHFTKRVGLSSDRITAIREVPGGGGVWVGTPEGLNHIWTNGTIRQFSKAMGLGANSIQSLYVDRKGRVWIGTAGGGLSIFQDGAFRTLTMDHGLPDNVVAQILEDDLDQFWIGTNRGIARTKMRDLEAFLAGAVSSIHWIAYGKAEGMRDMECAGSFQPPCLKSRDGRLWFCTVDGVAVIDPAKLPDLGLPPKTWIEQALIDDQNVRANFTDPNLRVEVPPGRHRIEFRYTGLSFAAPEYIRFKYLLEGYDSDWVEVGGRRSAYYTGVPPGQYRFRVLAGNNEGLWSRDGASIMLTVIPAWYQTQLFRVSALLLGAAILIGIPMVRLRYLSRQRIAQAAFSQRLIQVQEAERSRLARELHDGLGQELLLIRNKSMLGLPDIPDSNPASKWFREICDQVGRAIDELRATGRALRPPELDNLGLDLALSSMIDRVGADTALKVTSRLDPIDGLLPADREIHLFRIVQEALNNTIKHGRASEIWIDLEKNAQKLQLRIQDDGQGFDTASSQGSNGLGLRTIQERARFLGAKTQILSSPGKGVCLILEIPLTKQ